MVPYGHAARGRGQALAYNAGAAGFTLLSMVNFILIIILGFDKDAVTAQTKPLLAGDGADNI